MKSEKSKLELIHCLDKIVTGYSNNNLSLTNDELLTLYKVATASKIPLYFLEQLNKLEDNCFSLKSDLDTYRLRYAKMIDLVKETSVLFKNNHVEYVFFKTLRPFPSVGSDIDILVFNRPINQMLPLFSSKYALMDCCEDNATFYSSCHDLKLDIHTSLSVSLFSYLDVAGLRSEVVETAIDGKTVNVLTPEAEAVVASCHSVFKEQMLTLQDCYLLQAILPLCNKNKLLTFITKNRVAIAFELSLAVTTYILSTIRNHQVSFQLWSSDEFVEAVSKYEFARFINSAFTLPYKYSICAVVPSFAQRALLSKEGQKGTALIVKHLCNKAFVRRLIDRLPQHLQRSSY